MVPRQKSQAAKCQEKKYVSHIDTHVIRIHVRRKNIHATYMPHVSYHAFRNTRTAPTVEYDIHVRYMSNNYYLYETRVRYI